MLVVGCHVSLEFLSGIADCNHQNVFNDVQLNPIKAYQVNIALDVNDWNVVVSLFNEIHDFLMDSVIRVSVEVHWCFLSFK
jgi:hypothetical protein